MTTQEKVELEQVPLKSDVDAPPMIDDGVTEKEITEPAKKKTTYRWFFRSKKGDVTTNNGELVSEGKKSPCKWWHRKEKSILDGATKDATQSPMTVGVNLLDRDEGDLNDHIVMDFGEVFAEPDACHSWNWTWLGANRVFGFTSNAVYKIVASLIAIPLAIVFGIVFGLLSVLGVFICTPVGRLLSVPCMAVAKAWNFAVRKVLDPIFASLGLMCPKAHQRSTITTSPTDLA
ncbi:unnamed protein product [Enterobius vermicularis]|uniref:Caveolin n=1 Tax=Enterobius vermicularis TaxID=51028 RepID=A0A0N4UUT9_ENTVE|nr:unnamed protein product [Enterobius vermicularis]